MYYVLPQYARGHYSNLGFALLGRALEKRTPGTTYEQYLQKNVFDPLNMTNAGFAWNPSVAKKMAVGTALTPDGKRYKAQISEMGWTAPMGAQFSSSRDLAKFISFMFRNTKPADNKEQILDGATINEWLGHVMSFADGIGGFGMGWEPNYVGGFWGYSKAGELDGYRSQITIVPGLKLGVFASATITTFPEDASTAVFNIPALQILNPAFTAAVKKLQLTPPLPTNWRSWVGSYQGPDNTEISVFNQQNQLWVVTVIDGEKYNPLLLVPFPANNPDPATLQTKNPDPQVVCRWLDDGTDYEIAYATFDPSGHQVTNVTYMGQQFNLM